MVSAEYVTQALEDVSKELAGGQLKVEDTAPVDEAVDVAGEEGKQASSSSSSSSESENEAEDPEDRRERAERQKLLDDLLHSVKRTFEKRQEEAREEAMDPHTLDFANIKKQKLFESLARSLSPPTPLREAELRNQMEETNARVKKVLRAIAQKPRTKLGRARGPTGGDALHVAGQQTVEVTLPHDLFKPGELGPDP